MATDIKSIIDSHLPIDSSGKTTYKQLSVEVVDKFADELATTYNNIAFRRWYCGVIYEFGVAKVKEWQQRAKEGKQPARLFSKYVQDGRKYKSTGRLSL